jgi:hypothetical protein
MQVSIVLTIAFLLALTGRADAASDIYNLGKSTCGKYLEQKRDDPQHADDMFYSWANGYVSGMNEALASAGQPRHDLGAKSAESKVQFIQDYCKEHPLGDYLSSVLALIRSLPLVTQEGSKH